LKRWSSLSVTLLLLSATNTRSLAGPDDTPVGMNLPRTGVLPPHALQSPILRDVNRLPLSFERNQGQTNARVRFLSHIGDSTLFLTPREAVFNIPTQTSSLPEEKEAGTPQTKIWSRTTNGLEMATSPDPGWKVVGVGDYHGDGFADLIFQNQTSNKTIVWYLQNGVFVGGKLFPWPRPLARGSSAHADSKNYYLSASGDVMEKLPQTHRDGEGRSDRRFSLAFHLRAVSWGG
jgi:hypothetical protein